MKSAYEEQDWKSASMSETCCGMSLTMACRAKYSSSSRTLIRCSDEVLGAYVFVGIFAASGFVVA
jgi:hypothetical protein